MAINPEIKRFEDFITTKLQPDLQSILDRRDNVYNEMAEQLSVMSLQYLSFWKLHASVEVKNHSFISIKLKNQIETIRNQQHDDGDGKDLKVMMDVGSDFFMQARM